jgi:hypothetical protein
LLYVKLRHINAERRAGDLEFRVQVRALARRDADGDLR